MLTELCNIYTILLVKCLSSFVKENVKESERSDKNEEGKLKQENKKDWDGLFEALTAQWSNNGQ